MRARKARSARTPDRTEVGDLLIKKHLLTFLFLLLAVFLYARGAAGPATGFLLLGGLAEIVFWFRILRLGKRTTKT